MIGISMTRLVIVEDDALLRQEIALHLGGYGFVVEEANSGSALNDLILREPSNFFIIDINLPVESGIEIANRIRKSQPDAGIVILSARTGITDKIEGYRNGGADFFLTKPVVPTELVLVLQGLVNRSENRQNQSAWQLSLHDRVLRSPNGDTVLRLTSKEKELILALTQAPKKTLSSGDLCDLFINSEGMPMTKHALEEVITRLRRKLKGCDITSADTMIQAVWGMGYQLCTVVVLMD
jgi:DNA-binding response OmpR family regulator